MKTDKTAIINEIIRFSQILTQCKYGAKDDEVIKKLIAENLANLSKITAKESEERNKRKYEKFFANLAACSGGGA